MWVQDRDSTGVWADGSDRQGSWAQVWSRLHSGILTYRPVDTLWAPWCSGDRHPVWGLAVALQASSAPDPSEDLS